MLLGDHLLTAEERASAARVWRHRAATERQAARLFADLAADLSALGADDALVQQARKASADEERHAISCREIVRHLGSEDSEPSKGSEPPAMGSGGLSPPAPDAISGAPEPGPPLRLGPPGLPPVRRALFASVALSCVTETLSAALLLEMRAQARDALIKKTVHEILRDEIDHGRIGWAHLAGQARRADVGWLAPHLPGMLRAAVPGELDLPGLAGLGILPRGDVLRLLRSVAAEVLFPGLERFGVGTAQARAALDALAR